MDPFHFIHILSACRNTDMEVTMIGAMSELLYRNGNKKATKSAGAMTCRVHRREVSEVKIIIETGAKEVADLIAALQGRQRVVLNGALVDKAVISAIESGEAVHLPGDEVGQSLLKHGRDLQKGWIHVKIDITQDELDALIRHLEAILARYESEAGAFIIAGECPGAKAKAIERLNEADSAAVLLDKLLHI